MLTTQFIEQLLVEAILTNYLWVASFYLFIYYSDTYSKGLRSNTRNAWNGQDFYNGACCEGFVDERRIHLAYILYKLRCW